MQGEELLAAVLAAPHDDGPRLVYADWLRDHGDIARSDFIRVQCALASGAVPASERPALEQREQELLAQFGFDWVAPLGADVTEWVFQRGFVERVGMYLERPAEEILRVFGKAPIRYLRDHSQMCDLSGLLAALPKLSHLLGLELWWLYAVEDELVRELLCSPHLAGLQTLILHHDRNGNMVDDEVVIEGLHSPHRANLRELAVNVDGMWRGPSNDVLDAIATSPWLRNLRRLWLSDAGGAAPGPRDLPGRRVPGAAPAGDYCRRAPCLRQRRTGEPLRAARALCRLHGGGLLARSQPHPAPAASRRRARAVTVPPGHCDRSPRRLVVPGGAGGRRARALCAGAHPPLRGVRELPGPVPPAIGPFQEGR